MYIYLRNIYYIFIKYEVYIINILHTYIPLYYLKNIFLHGNGIG